MKIKLDESKADYKSKIKFPILARWKNAPEIIVLFVNEKQGINITTGYFEVFAGVSDNGWSLLSAGSAVLFIQE